MGLYSLCAPSPTRMGSQSTASNAANTADITAGGMQLMTKCYSHDKSPCGPRALASSRPAKGMLFGGISALHLPNRERLCLARRGAGGRFSKYVCNTCQIRQVAARSPLVAHGVEMRITSTKVADNCSRRSQQALYSYVVVSLRRWWPCGHRTKTKEKPERSGEYRELGVFCDRKKI